MRHLRFRPRVADDLTVAARWYDEERRGLGNEFMAEVEATLDRIREGPLGFATVAPPTRRAIVNRFPYGIYFKPERDHGILVLAVIHLHRRPDSWRRKP